MYPTGTVFHPGRVRRLVGSLHLPLIFGRPVIVTDRYIHIFVPRRAQTWTVHWAGNRVRRSPRLRRITIDTDRQRRVVGDGIFAPRGEISQALFALWLAKDREKTNSAKARSA